MWLSPVLSAISFANTDLPVQGVPVTKIFGRVLLLHAMFAGFHVSFVPVLSEFWRLASSSRVRVGMIREISRVTGMTSIASCSFFRDKGNLDKLFKGLRIIDKVILGIKDKWSIFGIMNSSLGSTLIMIDSHLFPVFFFFKYLWPPGFGDRSFTYHCQSEFRPFSSS